MSVHSHFSAPLFFSILNRQIEWALRVDAVKKRVRYSFSFFCFSTGGGGGKKVTKNDNNKAFTILASTWFSSSLSMKRRAKRSWKWRTGTKHEGDERGKTERVHCCLFCSCWPCPYRAVVVAHFICAQFIFSRKLIKSSIGWSQQPHHTTTTTTKNNTR